MPPGISDPIMAQVSDLVATHLGLHFPRERWRDLERGLKAAAPELGFSQAMALAQWLVSSPVRREEIESLAGHLVIPETYFFREPRTMEVLEHQVLPRLIQTRQGSKPRLRIWSAGCSTGEEPYSLAILLKGLLPDIEEWEITLLATDISHRSLKKAMAGIYTRWSFRNTDHDFQNAYFRKIKEGHYALKPEIKDMVTFSQLNLATDPYPSLWNHTAAMDLIICRNVLMYFTPEVAGRVVDNFYRCLVNGGWLLVSAAESPLIGSVPLRAVDFPGVIVYRKVPEPELVRIEVDPALTRSGANETLMPMPGYALKEEAAIPPLPDFLLPSTPFQVIDEVAPSPEDAGVASPYEEALNVYTQGHYGDAEHKLLELLIPAPGNVAAMALLARTCANQGKLDEALQWAAKVAATDKLNAAGHYLLATIFQEQGRLEEAVAALKRTLYLDQDFVLAHFTLGHLALAQKRIQESRRHFGIVLSLLKTLGSEDILPESEGLTAGRLREMVASMGQSVGIAGR